MRREVAQALYDVLWVSRELRQGDYTMETALRLGLADHYAWHGSQGLERWLEVATDFALHIAEMDGIELSAVENRFKPGAVSSVLSIERASA